MFGLRPILQDLFDPTGGGLGGGILDPSLGGGDPFPGPTLPGTGGIPVVIPPLGGIGGGGGGGGIGGSGGGGGSTGTSGAGGLASIFSNPNILNNALSALGGLGSIFGAIQSTNNIDWLHGALGTVLANLQNNGTLPGTATFQQYAGMLGPNAQAGSNLGLSQLQNSLGPLLSGLQGQQSNLPGLMSQYTQNGYSNPLIAAGAGGQGQGGLQDLLGSLQGTTGLAQQVFGSGGYTPQGAQGFSSIMNLLQGGAPGSQNSAGVANNLIGGQGMTAYNQNAQNLSNDVMSSGGWIPQLNMALNPLQSILNNGGNTNQSNILMNSGNNTLNNAPLGVSGLTPTGATGELAALQGILQGGTNPATQALTNTGTNILSQSPLMSPAQAASLAANQSATTFQNQMKQQFEQAMLRGGGPGAITSGIQNEAVNDYANQGNQNVSAAVANALQQQQALQLQQQQQGTQMLTGGLGAQSNLLGNYSGLLGNLEGVAANRYGTGSNSVLGSGNLANSLLSTGLGTVPQLTNAAANYVSPYGQLGSNAANNQLGFLGAGSNLSNILQGGQLGGQNNLTNLLGTTNQYALGAGGLANSTTGTSANIANLLASLGISSGQLGLGQFGGLTGAQNQNFGQQNSFAGNAGNVFGSSNNPLLGLANAGNSLTQTGLSTQGGLFGNSGNTTSSPWSNLISG
jgi:hypothetical protein